MICVLLSPALKRTDEKSEPEDPGFKCSYFAPFIQQSSKLQFRSDTAARHQEPMEMFGFCLSRGLVSMLRK